MKSYTDLIQIAATPDEKTAVYRFRYQIYIEEMGKLYKNADHQNKLLTDELDSCATILYAQINNQIIGTVRTNWGEDETIFCDSNNSNFALDRFSRFNRSAISFNSRLMVASPYRKTMLPVDLGRKSYHLAQERQVLFNFVSCRPSLVAFFEKLGFKKYKQSFFDENSGEQIPLVFLLEDYEHMQKVRSPFIREETAKHVLNDRFLIPVWI